MRWSPSTGKALGMGPRLHVGDLVTRRCRAGLIVAARRANNDPLADNGNQNASYPFTYYVWFPALGIQGPLFAGELGTV